MPIFIKDFIWKQTYDHVVVNVPLKGTNSKNVDIFTSENYIKASFSPYLFEVFLNAPVLDEESICTFTDKDLIFDLKKSSPEEWTDISAKLSKEDKINLRKKMIERSHENIKQQMERRKERNRALHHLAVQQQIDRDSRDVKEIDEKKKIVKYNMIKEFENCEENILEHKTVVDLNDGVTDSEEVVVEKRENKVSDVQHTPHRIKETTSCSPLPRPCPLPRRQGSIQVTFTQRTFPTPSRESQTQQEEEWLKKQVVARRATGFVEEDLTPEEKNPTWLKDKGDSFYKVGNYLGAISAYSHAIKLGSKMASLFSNRSAAHLALGNLNKALEDCSQALDLLTPPVDANADARAKCHVRRATILSRLGLHDAAMADFEMALKIKPNDEQIIQNINCLKAAVNCQDSDDDDNDDDTDIIQLIPT